MMRWWEEIIYTQAWICTIKLRTNCVGRADKTAEKNLSTKLQCTKDTQYCTHIVPPPTKIRNGPDLRTVGVKFWVNLRIHSSPANGQTSLPHQSG